MNQNNAPVGTIATIGHPANDCRVIKTGAGWLLVSTGARVDPDSFRAGWDVVEQRRFDEATAELAELHREWRIECDLRQDVQQRLTVAEAEVARLTDTIGRVEALLSDWRKTFGSGSQVERVMGKQYVSIDTAWRLVEEALAEPQDGGQS